MITEDYVSFEVAKLLKEKGFDEVVHAYHNIFDKVNLDFNVSDDAPHLQIPCPTHQMAMKWLRKKNVYIYIEPLITISSEGYNLEGYTPWVTAFKGSWFNPLNKIGKVAYTQSYEEAVEEALKYSLENLI